MNAGEQLVSLSGLPTGSALAHLMAIQTGTGTGETVHSGTVRAVTSQHETFVQRKAVRKIIKYEKSGQTVSLPKNKYSNINTYYVLTPHKNAYGFTRPEEVFVIVLNSKETVVQSAINSVVAQRNKP